jgi:hypothetical protein
MTVAFASIDGPIAARYQQGDARDEAIADYDAGASSATFRDRCHNAPFILALLVLDEAPNFQCVCEALSRDFM